MATFLHIADVHLESRFQMFLDTKRAAVRRNEVRRTLSGIIDRAKSVDILLIAGDLFDGGNVSDETIAFLKRKFAGLDTTKVFIVAGNHDSYTENSIYARENFGDNVYVFKTTAECVELPELKVRVFGASFGEEFCDNRIDIPKIEKKDGFSDILLLHADLVSQGTESRYNGIDRAFVESCGADYLALGHIHKRSEPKMFGETYYAYPGMPEGRGFDECGDMGFYIGEINDGKLKIEFERSCARRMLWLEPDISGVSDNLGAAVKVREAMKNAGGEPGDMYKIVLKGRVTPGFLDIDIVKHELEEETEYIEIRNETLPDYDIDAIAEQNTLAGEFVRVCRRRYANSDAVDEIISIGIEAILGGGI